MSNDFEVCPVGTKEKIKKMEAALKTALSELSLVKDGHTGGIPNSIVALIPEAIEEINNALN